MEEDPGGHGLDAAERELRQLLAGGRVAEALDSYVDRMGAYRRLAWRLGAYAIGLRVTRALCEAGGPELVHLDGTNPWLERALFHKDLGELAAAESQLLELAGRPLPERLQMHDRPWAGGAPPPPGARSLCWHLYTAPFDVTLADLRMAQGRLPEAEHLLDGVVAGPGPFSPRHATTFHVNANPFARRARVRLLRGRVDEADADFATARDFAPPPADRAQAMYQQVYGHAGPHRFELVEVEALVRRGSLDEARRALARFDRPRGTATYDVVAATRDLLRSEVERLSWRVDDALAALRIALAWAEHTGHAETLVRAQLARGRCLLQSGDLDAARVVVDGAATLATRGGWALLTIDAQVLTGHVALREGRAEAALGAATEAHARCVDPGCDYAWGAGDAAHLAARAMLASNHVDDAREWANRALALRSRLGDPRRHATARLFDVP